MKVLKFNENWLRKKRETPGEEIKSGFKTLDRTETNSSRLSNLDKQKQIDSLNMKKDSSVDKYFLQEISDRIYGPDSEAYIEAIEELNKKFRSRGGRYGNQLYDDEFVNSLDRNVKK